jgi:hypothetical protein
MNTLIFKKKNLVILVDVGFFDEHFPATLHVGFTCTAGGRRLDLRSFEYLHRLFGKTSVWRY